MSRRSGSCVRGAIKWDAGSTHHGLFLVGKQAIKRAGSTHHKPTFSRQAIKPAGSTPLENVLSATKQSSESGLDTSQRRFRWLANRRVCHLTAVFSSDNNEASRQPGRPPTAKGPRAIFFVRFWSLWSSVRCRLVRHSCAGAVWCESVRARTAAAAFRGGGPVVPCTATNVWGMSA